MILRFSIVLEIGLSILISNSRTKDQLHFDPQNAFYFQKVVKNTQIGRKGDVNGTSKTDEMIPQNTHLTPNSTLMKIEGLHVTDMTGNRFFSSELYLARNLSIVFKI